MNTGVYRIRNIINNDCYVGSCSHKRGIKHRWKTHINSLKKGKHHSIILQRAWNKYGENSFITEIIEECEPSKCIEREQHYLDTLYPKYNILLIAGSSLGRKLTLEQIQKLKNRSYDWVKGDNSWTRTSEGREFMRRRIKANPIRINEIGKKKISDFQKGRPKSEIQKQRMSAAQLGVPKSKEHIEKMKKSIKKWAEKNNSGDKNYFYGRRFIGKTNPNFSGYFKFKNKITDDEVICSQSEFAKKFNFDSGKVSALCLGKRKTHKKWVCLGKEESYVKI